MDTASTKDVKKTQDVEEEDESSPFSQYYGMLSHQQNMLQDYTRTGTYERAMVDNPIDFKDKVVLDVGTGSGILAFFAVKAGAKKVYAVELSQMADCARTIVESNGLSDQITVLRGKVEEIDLPEKVDVIISEPMGFFLVHERMLECYVTARKLWLKPNGLMFPTVGTMLFAPFSDDSIYQEQMAKVAFWHQKDFYGLDLSSMADGAMLNHFQQPVVGNFPASVLLSSTTASHELDFQTLDPEDLHAFTVPFEFTITKTGL